MKSLRDESSFLTKVKNILFYYKSDELMNRKKVYLDLFIVIGLVFLADIFILIPELNETAVKKIFGLPLVLFLPGYALIAALFPAKYDLKEVERIALSFGLSITVVPLIGLGLNYTPWGIRLIPILISLSVFTIVLCVVAYITRIKLSETEDFKIPFGEIAISLKAEILGKTESKLDRVLTIILVLSILLSVIMIVYAIGTPVEGEHFTEFYILGHGGKADSYPTNYTLGQSGTLIVGAVNHEYKTVNYTMEIKLENQSLPIRENLQHITLAQNEKFEEPITFTPPFEGQNMKLEFLLFNEADKQTPYRNLHLLIDVNKTEIAKSSNA